MNSTRKTNVGLYLHCSCFNPRWRKCTLKHEETRVKGNVRNALIWDQQIQRFFFGTSAKQSKTRSSLIVKRFISRKWKKNMTQFMYWQWNPVSFNLMPGGSDSEWKVYGSTRRTVTITEIQYCFNVHWASLEGSKAPKVLSLNWRIVVAGSNFIFLCVGLFFFPSFFISCITLTEAESE